MKQTTGTGDPRESVEPLTARQREVLELIARGYTNPQIADALGVTIDGAKWHVREILSKLGVESREEAAEWWRHERSAGTRLRRAITGLGSLGALRWVSGVAVVALLTAAGVLALVALRDDDGGRLAPDVLPTAGGPSTATAPPTATESASAEGTLGEIDGRVVYELHYVEEPVDVPRSVLLYYVDQCGVCSGGTLYRGSVSSSGEWAAEELPYAGRGVPAGSQIGPIVSDGQGRFAMLFLCLTDYGLCDKHYEGFQDVPRAVVWSKDAGVTWSVAGEAPLGAAPVGFYQGEVVLASSTTGDTPATYTLLPSGNPWLPAEPRRVPAVPDEVTVGGVTYSLSYEDETFVDDNLSYPGATLIASENAAEPMLAFPGGQVRSVHELPDGRLIGVAERSAKAYLLEDPDRVLPAVGRDLVLIDLVRREVRPVAAPAATNESSYIVLVSVVGGPFARVDTPGSCLNVRPQPSTAGESLGCFADGVMLYDLDETADAGGITWLRVETPDRREGWASLEFIERLR